MSSLEEDVDTVALSPATPQAHDGRRLARLGLIAAMVSRLFGRVVGIVLVVVLAREADPETVAVYGYLLGTATLVTSFTDLGVASVAGREVAAGRMPADGALRAALGPQLVSVLVAAVLTTLLSAMWGPGQLSAATLVLAVLFVIVSGLNNLWAELLRATGRVVLEGALQLGSAAGLVGVGALVVVAGGDATDLLAVVALKEVVALLIAVCVIRPRRRTQVNSRMLLRSGVWLAVASTSLVVLWRQGTLVVGSTGSLAVLATYVVATRFFDAGVTVAHTAGFGLLPGMSALAGDPVAFRATARRYVGLAALAGLAVAAVGGAFAGPLTTLPFGAQWVTAVPAVRWVAISGLPILLGYVLFPVLIARGQSRWMVVSTVTGAVLGIAVTMLLVHLDASATSAVLGTGIGALVMVVLLLTGVRDLLLPARVRPAGSAPG
jgi:O-antigen/teichoic acid export membrane protein